MDRSFSLHIEQQFPFLMGKKLLLACSGGVDSVVLAHLLYEEGFTIGLAHCNFSLRGMESDEDETFVNSLSKKWEVPFYSEQFDTETYAQEHKLSVQMAARELRYRWFDTLLKEEPYDYVLTGHHADDDLETFFINLSRGTGLKGLTGIPVLNEKVVRPLLNFSRDQLMTYAKAHGLYWREDSSNAKSDYLRNRLRHEVIPPFKEATKTALKNFHKTQANLRGSQALIDDYMTLIQNLVLSKTEEGYKIQIEKLRELPNTKALLYELLSPFNFTAWGDIMDLLEGQSGKKVFSSSHRLIKDRDFLLLTEHPSDTLVDTYYLAEGTSEIEEPIYLRFEDVERFEITNAHTVFVDKESLSFPLVLRRWEEGDVFHPFGMQGKKKLSKYFKDEKLSLIAKENTWVLCSDNDIVWVVGLRLDERFKVEKSTAHILKIVYNPQ
ncbi:MAG: tRNA lysidine(34) synthetase TilS [Bacteroidota bacterium]